MLKGFNEFRLLVHFQPTPKTGRCSLLFFDAYGKRSSYVKDKTTKQELTDQGQIPSTTVTTETPCLHMRAQQAV